jgi:RHS repeat-associated protein
VGTQVSEYSFNGHLSKVDHFGLIYFRARWFDPSLGRFSSPDTLIPGTENPEAWDRYSFSFNNPINLNDPSGHNPCYGINDPATRDACLAGYYGEESSETVIQPDLGTYPEDPPDDTDDETVTDDNTVVFTIVDENGSITEYILQLPGSAEDWTNLATTLDILALLSDFYAAGTVTYAGFAGAALPAPLIAIGLPEVPLATGFAGMAIAELFVQPVLKIGNILATASFGATIVADTKIGTTRLEDFTFSNSVLNSAALTAIGWLSNEAYLSLIIQSITVANDFKCTSFPFPVFP